MAEREAASGTALAIVPVDSEAALRPSIGGRTSLAWVLSALGQIGVARIVVAPQLTLDQEDVEGIVHRVCPGAGLAPPRPGRVAALRAALAMEPGPDRVLICDADQPLVTTACLRAVLAGIDERSGVVSASPVKATVKRVAGGVIQETVPRERLCYLQGQRAFPRKLLERVIEQGPEHGDEVAAARAAGARLSIHVCDGPALRVRGPADAALAEMLLVPDGRAHV